MKALRPALLVAITLLTGLTPLHGEALELRVSLSTGDVTIGNPGVDSVVLDGYSIDSTSESLLPAGWLSVADNYDSGAESDGSVDSVSEWFVLSGAAGSLAEGSLTALSGSIAGGQSVALGPIWSTTGAGDLTFDYLAGETQFSAAPIYFFEGDTNRNEVVAASDYAIWRDSISDPAALDSADTNRDGVVDNGDFMVWQSQFGESNPFAVTPIATVAVASIVIPEPASLLLMATAIAGSASIRSRRRAH